MALAAVSSLVTAMAESSDPEFIGAAEAKDDQIVAWSVLVCCMYSFREFQYCGFQVNKKFVAAALGNWLEWYDFGVYAALADLLGQHFFPDHDASVQVMQSFLAFAAGYISRPVGGIFVGIIGDRLGRKCALWLGSKQECKHFP